MFQLNNISITIGGVPHKLFSDGMKGFDLWKNILKRYEYVEDNFKEISFHNDKFSIFINFKSTLDNNMDGDGIEVGKRNDGIRLKIDHEGTSSKLIVNCYIYCISESALFIQERIVKEYRI